MGSTFKWKQARVDGPSEGTNAEGIEVMKKARLAVPLDLETAADEQSSNRERHCSLLPVPLDRKATADEWWTQFMDEDELPTVGCKPTRPVKVAAHKLVLVEETRKMMRGLHIGTHDAADAECGAGAECTEVMPRGAQKAVVKESITDAEMVIVARMAVAEDWSRFNQNKQGQGGFYGDCSIVKEQLEKDAAYTKFLDQEMVLEKKGDSWQRYNGKPPQNENRSAIGACTSYAAGGTVIAALMQTRAMVEGKVAMFKHTPSEVCATVRKKVTNEVMWMVHRQLRRWHRKAGGVSIIDNEAPIADWVTAMAGALRLQGGSDRGLVN